jgi:hypothetical protein
MDRSDQIEHVLMTGRANLKQESCGTKALLFSREKVSSEPQCHMTRASLFTADRSAGLHDKRFRHNRIEGEPGDLPIAFDEQAHA